MTDVLYDKLVYGRDLTAEQWSKLQYRPVNNEDLYGIVENPSFGIDKSEIEPIVNNTIKYTSLTFYDAEGLYEMIQSIPTITIVGPRLMSNEWENGNGVLTFDGDITTIGFEGDISTAATIYSWVFLNYVELGITNDITSVTLPKSVTSIGDSAFQKCITLTSVNIPNSVTVIGNYAFEGCGGLTSVVIPDTVTEICSGAFSGCSALTSVIIPDSVTKIGKGAFYGCSALTSVIIGNSVTEIMRNAFEGCGGLISIIIPDSVERIGSYAFSDCSNLTEVTCLVTNPPTLGTYNFTTSNGILYVLADSVQAYLHNTNWNTAFNGNIQAIWSTEVTEVADMAIVGEMSIEPWSTPYAYPNYIDKTIICYDKIPTAKEFKIVYCPNNTIDWDCNYDVESNSEPLNNTKINLNNPFVETGQNIIIDSSLGENANVYIDTITGKIWAETDSE